MRICLVYDCLFPYTVGGAERWYRNLAERLAAEGHEVTYLTLRQWERGERGEVPGRAGGRGRPAMELYAEAGRRRILPPLVFGLGVLGAPPAPRPPLRRGPHGVVSLLLAAAASAPRAASAASGWWSTGTRCGAASTGSSTSGAVGGRIGNAVQALCMRIPQRAFCFSRLHARRLVEGGLRGEPTLLEGEYAGPLDPRSRGRAEPLVVFAGRHIPEKRVPALVPAVAAARNGARPSCAA